MNARLIRLRTPLEPIKGVWRASALSPLSASTLASGHAALDHELPGQGWPLGQLTELLQTQPGLHEWRLLWPALRLASVNGPLALIGAPHPPHLSALCSLGIAPDKVLWIDARLPIERLWAAEQVLRCHELGALLAWLPQARAEQLRRLQLAANTSPARRAPAFVMRPIGVRHEASPAPLRLTVQAADRGLSVQILKRRGPVLAQALWLAAPLPVMTALRRGEPREKNHAVDRPERTLIQQQPSFAA